MPAMDVLRQHEAQWIVAVVLEEMRLDARGFARAVTIPPVENHALVDRDRLDQSVRPDVGDQLVEWFALEKRHDPGERVRRQPGGLAAHDGGLRLDSSQSTISPS